jgi:hypothetical protein
MTIYYSQEYLANIRDVFVIRVVGTWAASGSIVPALDDR